MKGDRFLLGILVGVIGFATPAIAQLNLIPDTAGDRSLGTTITPFNAQIDLIRNGTRSANGLNLFHSFQEFNIDEGRRAFFIVPDTNIVNILTRVTGRNSSQILGVLGSRQELPNGNFSRISANLFLMNPNGIIFGENAWLDVGGSFAATTANAIEFGDRGIFSATNPGNGISPLIVDPSAYLFSQVPTGNIVNRSYSKNNVLGLQVPDRKTLLLLGGNITFDGGRVSAFGGRVEIGAVANSGRVGINTNGSLNIPNNIRRADVLLTKDAWIDTMSDNAGDIAITSRNIDLKGGSGLYAGIFRNLVSTTGKAGDIVLNATETVNLSESSRIYNIVSSEAIGSAGNIFISTGSLNLNKSDINSSATGQGNAGNIILNVEEKASFMNNSRLFSNIGSPARQRTVGNVGNISLIAQSVLISEASQIQAGFYANTEGKSGVVSIQAKESVVFTGDNTGIFNNAESGVVGNGSDIQILAKSVVLQDGASFFTGSAGKGNSGSINISADILEMSNSTISSSAVGQGNAGNIILNLAGKAFLTNNSLILSNVGSPKSRSTVDNDTIGNIGNISLTAQSVLMTEASQIQAGFYANTAGKAGLVSVQAKDSIVFHGKDTGIFTDAEQDVFGNGSDMQISARSVTLKDGAGLTSRSAGNGKAGNILVQGSDFVILKDANILTDSVKASGGNLTMISATIRLLGDSNLLTIVSVGNSQAGNITLNANSVIALNDSDILTFALQGRGGNVTLNTRAFFGQNYRPEPFGTNPRTLNGNDRVDINASGSLSSGRITTPDTSFIQNSLNQLPKDTIDTTKLLANTCIVRKDKPEGTLYITGTGGLPNRPGDRSPSQYPTNTIAPTQTATRPWQKGDPIEEPQGFYQLSNGRLVMSRECSSTIAQP